MSSKRRSFLENRPLRTTGLRHLTPGFLILHHCIHHLRHHVLQRDAPRTFGIRFGFRLIQRLRLRIPSGLRQRLRLRRRRRIRPCPPLLFRRGARRRFILFGRRFFLPGVDRFRRYLR